MATYINVVTCGVLCHEVIFTSNFENVKTKLQENKCVVLLGPKGYGKSVLCVVMYLMMFDCLFITPNSFEFNGATFEYFQELTNRLCSSKGTMLERNNT